MQVRCVTCSRFNYRKRIKCLGNMLEWSLSLSDLCHERRQYNYYGAKKRALLTRGRCYLTSEAICETNILEKIVKSKVNAPAYKICWRCMWSMENTLSIIKLESKKKKRYYVKTLACSRKTKICEYILWWWRRQENKILAAMTWAVTQHTQESSVVTNEEN